MPVLKNDKTGDDGKAASPLFEELYAQLRILAESELRNERSGHTLQPTALVNEAYTRVRGSLEFQSKEEFLSYATTAMRRILVDHARARRAQKRGGGKGWRLTLTADDIRTNDDGFDVLEIHDALARFEQVEPRQARVVELRYFGGLHVATVASVLGISEETARRDWIAAKAWFSEHLTGHCSG